MEARASNCHSRPEPEPAHDGTEVPEVARLASELRLRSQEELDPSIIGGRQQRRRRPVYR